LRHIYTYTYNIFIKNEEIRSLKIIDIELLQ